MSGLDSQDASSCGQVVFAHDIGSSTQVSTNTDPFKDAGCLEERLDVRDAESIGAWLHWSCASFFQGPSEERHMDGLVGADLFEVVVKGRVEAGGAKVGLGEIC